MSLEVRVLVACLLALLFSTADGLTCGTAPTNCASCTTDGGNLCDGCNAGYWLSATRVCTACTVGSTKAADRAGGIPADGSQSQASCSSCASPCSTCLGLTTTCIDCTTGYYKNITTPPAPSPNPICAQCSFPCAVCTDATPAGCSACIDGFYGNSTVPCAPCSSPCKTCSGNGFTCTTCIDGYWKTASGTTCSTCPKGCATCSSNTTCTTCQSDFVLNSTSGLCTQFYASFAIPNTTNASNATTSGSWSQLLSLAPSVSGFLAICLNYW